MFDYAPGDFVVEARNAWHSGTAVGDGPVVLVIEQFEAPADDAGNTVLRDPTR